MKTSRIALLIVIVLSLAILAGCQQGYSGNVQVEQTTWQQNDWVPTGSGF